MSPSAGSTVATPRGDARRRVTVHDATEEAEPRGISMSRLDEIGDRDGWRCWICDEPVDADTVSYTHLTLPTNREV